MDFFCSHFSCILKYSVNNLFVDIFSVYILFANILLVYRFYLYRL